MIRKDIFYIVFFGGIIIVMMGIIFFRNTRGKSPEDLCEIHKELFNIQMDSGYVVDKYVDRKNHAIKTVILNSNGKNYRLLFIPYDNWRDFDSVKVNDMVVKKPYSFDFVVNNEFAFTLKLTCAYQKSKHDSI